MPSSQARPPTMRQVAEQVGVSIQTVSAVINGKPGITPDTQARVRAAIEALGYRPYAGAASLRTRQSKTLALLVPDIANPFCSAIASAAEDLTHAAGYSLILYNTHDDSSREEAAIHALARHWVDGVLYVAAGDQLKGLEALAQAGIPAVSLDRIPEKYCDPAVTLDNVAAGRLATEHLIGLGHTCIAHISGPLHLRLARERQQGYLETLISHGLAPASCVGGVGAWECSSGYRAAQAILACEPRPTAIFAASDRMAIGAMRAIHEAGLATPDDISVVGLDDIEVAAFQTPPLTTVRQSFARLATTAVELLLALLRGETLTTPQVMVQGELVVRQSTAAPHRN